jgi:hypothetical protein
MQPFTLKAVCRLVKTDSVWDREASEWKSFTLKTPRPVDNPPQVLTEEQSAYLKKLLPLLGENIRLDHELKEEENHRRKLGAEAYIGLHYALLKHDGYAEIEETPAMRQLTKYLWDLADRQQAGQITWAAFEDEVERWYLLVVDKLEAMHGPKTLKAGA